VDPHVAGHSSRAILKGSSRKIEHHRFSTGGILATLAIPYNPDLKNDFSRSKRLWAPGFRPCIIQRLVLISVCSMDWRWRGSTLGVPFCEIMPAYAPRHCAGNGMVMSIMTGHAANHCAFDAALGLSDTWRGNQRACDCDSADKKFHQYLHKSLTSGARQCSHLFHADR
jgi:hypothetical protein